MLSRDENGYEQTSVAQIVDWASLNRAPKRATHQPDGRSRPLGPPRSPKDTASVERALRRLGGATAPLDHQIGTDSNIHELPSATPWSDDDIHEQPMS